MLLRSSTEPSSPTSIAKLYGSLQKFMNTVKAEGILQDSLTSYIWDSSIAQGKADRRKTRKGTYVQNVVLYMQETSKEIYSTNTSTLSL